MRRSNVGIGIALLVALFLAASAFGQTPVALTGTGETVKISPGSSRTFSFSLPKMEQPLTAVLTWEARIDADVLRTGREFTAVEVNGRPFGSMRDRLSPRLLNKPLAFTDHRLKEHNWYVESVQGWMTPFSPDFSAPGPLTWFYKDGLNAYVFKVDVTDLLQQGSQNSVAFRNLMQVQYFQTYKEKLFTRTTGNLVLKNIRIEFLQSTKGSVSPEAQIPSGSLPWSFAVEPTGEMVISWGEDKIAIESEFAKGDGTWTVLGRGREVPAPLMISPSEWKLALETGSYRLERTVKKEKDRILLRDRFIRTGKADPVPVLPRYRILVPKNRLGTVWIGGDPDPSLKNASRPFNPTLFIPMGRGGLGVAIEDDVLRLQSRFAYDAAEGVATIRSEELVISQKSGNEYTVALCLYPAEQGGYWDFINRVRMDRTPVVTLPGTIWFAYPDQLVHATPESLSRIFETNKVAYVVFWEHLNPQGNRLPMPYIVRGTGQLEPGAEKVMGPYEETAKKAIALVRAASKKVKVLLYLNSYTCSVLNEAQRAALSDSWVTGRDSRPINRHEGDKRFYPLYFVYPTEQNAYGRQLALFVERLLSLGADGVYWDEMAAATGDVKVTYSAFDGCTADVDPVTQKVQRVKGLVGLLSSPYRARLVKRLVEAGRTVHANSAPETRAMETLPITRMVETQDSAGRTYELHLTTPYAYTWGPFTMEQFRDRLAKGGICFRPDKGSPFIAASFPMTPVSLGSGSVTGREKIITCKDGTFGWQGPWQGILTLYDRSGQQGETRKIQGQSELDIRVPQGGLAVIERIP